MKYFALKYYNIILNYYWLTNWEIYLFIIGMLTE